MAFINDYLKESEDRELSKLNYAELKWRGKYNSPKKCTVDRENNIWLIRMPRGYDWNPKERIDKFIFFYGGICKENVYEVYLSDMGKEEDSNVLKSYEKEFIRYWQIKKIKRPKEEKITEIQLLCNIEKALESFGFDGSIEWNSMQIKSRFKAILKK